MRRIGTPWVLGLALACGLAAPALANPPAGKRYAVTVFGKSGGPFTDCFAFTPWGQMTIQGFGQLIWRFDALDSELGAFQAAPTLGNLGFGLLVHGTVQGEGGETMAGDIATSDGATFVFQGVLVSGCKGNRAPGQSYR
ncbi:MAG: hypothetical protein AB7I59_05935 [Geminicoccaceae bacterium]